MLSFDEFKAIFFGGKDIEDEFPQAAQWSIPESKNNDIIPTKTKHNQHNKHTRIQNIS